MRPSWTNIRSYRLTTGHGGKMWWYSLLRDSAEVKFVRHIMPTGRNTITEVMDHYGLVQWKIQWERNTSWGCLRMGADGDIWAWDGRGNMGLEKNTQWGALWSVILTEYHSGDQIEKNEMGGACSTYGREENCIQGFVRETWGKEITWETQEQMEG